MLRLELNAEKHDSLNAFRAILDRHLESSAARFPPGKSKRSLAERFLGVIERAHEQIGERVVVLVDEYDKPLLSLIGQPELLEGIRLDASEFADYRADPDRPLPVIYQSGYLAIRDYEPEFQLYTQRLTTNLRALGPSSSVVSWTALTCSDLIKLLCLSEICLRVQLQKPALASVLAARARDLDVSDSLWLRQPLVWHGNYNARRTIGCLCLQRVQHEQLMSTFSRRPCAALTPWVKLLWATHLDAAELVEPHWERVLPTGAIHVVLRLSDSPLTLFENTGGEASRSLGHVIVGGARSRYYVKLAGDNVCSVGVQLQPGGALALLGVPASELAERHTPLDVLWGLDSALLREQLHDVRQRSLSCARQACSDVGMRAQVDFLESVLLSRVGRAHADERQLQWLADAISALEVGVPLATVVEGSRVSHRTFIMRFRNMVGLSPKMFARIRRFQRVVEALSQTSSVNARAKGTRGPERRTETEPLARRGRCADQEDWKTRAGNWTASRLSLAQLALEAGYADQAHLSRDFVEFAGVSPTTYSRLAPAAPNHVEVLQ